MTSAVTWELLHVSWLSKIYRCHLTAETAVTWWQLKYSGGGGGGVRNQAQQALQQEQPAHPPHWLWRWPWGRQWGRGGRRCAWGWGRGRGWWWGRGGEPWGILQSEGVWGTPGRALSKYFVNVFETSTIHESLRGTTSCALSNDFLHFFMNVFETLWASKFTLATFAKNLS